MNRELVFKFQDWFQLPAEVKTFLGITKEHEGSAYQYAKEAGYKIVDSGQLTDGDEDWKALLTALKTISIAIGRKPESMIIKSLLATPLDLLRAVKQRPDSKLSPINFGAKTKRQSWPNLYAYFKFRIPSHVADEVITEAIYQLKQFMTQPLINVKINGLLEFVYLKGNPVSLGYPTAEVASAYANQSYFATMHIPDSASKGSGVGVTVLEAYGWDISHPQFADEPFELVFPLPENMAAVNRQNYSLTNPGRYRAYAKHGNKILGILKAKIDRIGSASTGLDLCRGIIPEATIRLASCLTGITPSTGTNNFESTNADEASALLTAIHKADFGDIILIEIGYDEGRYPLDVAPAIYEMVQVAKQKDITVIAAAGNRSLFLPIVTNTTNAGAIETVSFRNEALSLIDSVRHPREEAYWDAYMRLKPQLVSEYGADYVGYTSANEFVNCYLSRPSGAILVGAALINNQGLASLKPQSSRGPRVRVFAQGQNILTTTVNNQYDLCGETSGAAAIIAGIAAALQSMAKASGKLITPDGMAILLAQGMLLQMNTPATAAAGFVPKYEEAANQVQSGRAGS